MIIVNADDWGLSREATDSALACHRAGSITSASAMVFMEDSGRAAAVAQGAGLALGLHLNLSERFTGTCADHRLLECHDRIVRFLTNSRYAVLLYHPVLRGDFRYVYHSQWNEFLRLYGRPPTHVDGHHHKHLCANMLVDRIIADGTKVRRNFSFAAGEKSALNRGYRKVVDHWLARRYVVTDYFFDLNAERLPQHCELGREATVEIMVHPARPAEYDCLMSPRYRAILSRYMTGSYAAL